MNIDNLNQYMATKQSKFRSRNTTRANIYTRAQVPTRLALANVFSKLDPLSDERVDISGSWDVVPSGSCSAYQVWMELDYNDTHFWYKAVYKLVNQMFLSPSDITGEENESLSEFHERYSSELRIFLEPVGSDNSWRNPSRSLFSEDQGTVYLLVSGGGPIDGLSIGDISEIDTQLDSHIESVPRERGYRSLLLGHNLVEAKLPLSMNNHFDKMVAVTLCNGAHKYTNRLSMTGESLIQPTGTKGYIEAEAVHSTHNLSKFLSKLKWDDDALINKVMQYNGAYKPYTGWIPNDLSDVLFTTDKFSMVRVDREPKLIFSSEIKDRYTNKRLDFSACVNLLYGGKKYSVDPGVYFMKVDDLEQLTMIEYDSLIQKLLEDVTLLTVSSRSQAITNTSGTVVSDKIKTSITPRELSQSVGDDSGVIARPTARKLG